jgi:hypothetical protein
MNRALPLLALTLAVGGGLAFFALKTSPSGPVQDLNEDPISMSEEAAPPRDVAPKATPATEAQLADIGEETRASVVAPGGRARAWEIIPMNAVGQRMDSATVEAVPSEAVGQGIPALTGSGRTKWEDVPSGIWTLTVTAEGSPTWTREIEVRADKTIRTPVAMGPEIRITGFVQDSNGSPLSAKTPVFLLAKNAVHPLQAQGRGNPKRSDKSLPDGVIAAQLDARGRFQARLPEAGEYRISIGDIRSAEAPRWTQQKAFEATYGGPDHVVATVPARPELTISFPGPKEQRPTAVASYVFDAERAAQIARSEPRQTVRDSSMTLEEAQRAAKLEAMGYVDGEKSDDGSRGRGGGAGGKGQGRAGQGRAGRVRGGSGTARSAADENRRMQERDFEEMENNRLVDRAPLFEPGWRSIGSRPVDANGEVVFTDLPEQEDLRFLFVRGQERISTQTPIRMRAEQRGLGEATLPTPSPSAERTTSNLAAVRVTDRPEDPEVPGFPTGVVWSVGKR